MGEADLKLVQLFCLLSFIFSKLKYSWCYPLTDSNSLFPSGNCWVKQETEKIQLNKTIFLMPFCFYFWLCCVSVAACRLSLLVVSSGYSSWQCAGFSLQRLLLLWSTGSRYVSSVVGVHRLSCSMACEIFPTQGLNPGLPHCRQTLYCLSHQGSHFIGHHSSNRDLKITFQLVI